MYIVKKCPLYLEVCCQLQNCFNVRFPFELLADVIVAPPFVYIDQVKTSLTDRIEVSAQNSWVGKGGAFTGEIR